VLFAAQCEVGVMFQQLAAKYGASYPSVTQDLNVRLPLLYAANITTLEQLVAVQSERLREEFDFSPQLHILVVQFAKRTVARK